MYASGSELRIAYVSCLLFLVLFPVRSAVWSLVWSLVPVLALVWSPYERAQRACIAKRIAFLTRPTRGGTDNIYVTKRVIHMITFKQFFNENANHYSLIKYKTSYANLTDDQMEQIDYEVGIEWRDYRMERV
jgi:hypothetical protein